MVFSLQASHNDHIMQQVSLADFQWLTSADAAPWLDQWRSAAAPSVAQIRQLRRQLSAQRTHLVLEQCELRRRAAAKFDAAERLFFTRTGLEQATDQGIAAFKASRFPAGQPVADLCCGIGGDLLALARHDIVTGVDLSPIHAWLAQANAHVLELSDLSVMTANAADWRVDQYAAWHLDPDRRALGRRAAQMIASEPSLDAIRHLLQACPHAALKLAPAADVPEDWSATAERQWLASGRECRQQVVWFGALAEHPGLRSAVIVDRQGAACPPLVGQAHIPCTIARAVRQFVYEPHACVLAAQLTGELAAQLKLEQLDAQAAYLTGDRPLTDPRLSGFKVLDTLPFDIRHLRSALRARQIGHVEVKKRGIAIDPAVVQRQLQGRGEQSAILIISPQAGAILAERL